MTDKGEDAMRYDIVQDDDPVNPRTEYENLGTMLYTSTRYNLGDRRVTADEIEAVVQDDNAVVLPVFAYIHGGTTLLSTSPFSCPWDSGQCGVIYTTKDKVIAAWQRAAWSNELEELAKAALKAEVDTFAAYVAGEVYGWRIINDRGDMIESCHGYDSKEDAETDAKQSLATHQAERARRNEHTIEYGG